MTFALIEHTADIGIHVQSADLNGLFQDAASALFTIIAGNLDAVNPTQFLDIQLEGEDLEYLLLDWLTELLTRFDVGKMLFAGFQVHVTSHGLSACISGEPIDFSRHHLRHEVKAVTYHGLNLSQTPCGWQAKVIVDI